MPIAQNKRFAQWLVQARLDAGLTQEKVAEYLDIAHPSYLYWEKHGRMWMEPEQVRRLATILHRPATEVAAALGYPVGGAISRDLACDPTVDDLAPPAIARQIAALANRLRELAERQRDDDIGESDKEPDTAA